MTDLLVLLAVLAVAAVTALLWRARQGRVVAAEGALPSGARAAIGAPADGEVLVLFTAPACGSCAAARQVLEAVAAERASVAVAEVDVATQWELARDQGVLRAPTVLVVDEGGAVRARVSGVPDRDGVIEALAA